jgi:hypothetical protein
LCFPVSWCVFGRGLWLNDAFLPPQVLILQYLIVIWLWMWNCAERRRFEVLQGSILGFLKGTWVMMIGFCRDDSLLQAEIRSNDFPHMKHQLWLLSRPMMDDKQLLQGTECHCTRRPLWSVWNNHPYISILGKVSLGDSTVT